MAANPSDSPRHYYSLEEYFALEHAGDARYEYWDGEIFCMSGGNMAHARISTNIVQLLGLKLVGGPCLAFSADLAIKTPTLLPYRYPDASIVCGEPKVENINGVDALLNPVVIVEVISPSTESRDRGPKFSAYQQIASLQEYLIVAQKAAQTSHYSRRADGEWSSPIEIRDISEDIRLNSVNCGFSMSEVYQGVTFTNPK
jgi:Uma2 family endonuclease